MKSTPPGGSASAAGTPALGLFQPLSPRARAANLKAAWAERDETQGIWVFGYGSLMWNPCFSFTERQQAELPGFQRKFCIWTTLARGTPAAPGLGLGLEPAKNTCPGIAFRLDPAHLERDLAAIWEREMYSGVYRARWLPLETARGPRTALCFVVDPAHRQYAGDLPRAQQAEIIAGAVGKYGSCRDYLAGLVTALREIAIDDLDLSDLLAQVDALSDSQPPEEG